MSILPFRSQAASLVWLDGHRVKAGGHARAAQGLPTEDQLAQALAELPAGPTSWVVDDLWAPSALVRDIVELPPGAEAREGFFRWKFGQALALEGAFAVQSLEVEEGVWLMAGIQESLRESWQGVSVRMGRPIHRLVPRWMWVYNRLAPSLELPGMLLSLNPVHGPGEAPRFTGSLVAWGRSLCLLRQWSEPLSPEAWNLERIAPSAAFLHRESRSPQKLHVFGAGTRFPWPSPGIPVQVMDEAVPDQEVG